MAVTVRIPSPLRKFTGGQGRLPAEAGTVASILEGLAVAHSELHARLFAEAGALRPEVRVFVGEKDIRNLEDLDTQVAEGQTVALILPVAGA